MGHAGSRKSSRKKELLPGRGGRGGEIPTGEAFRPEWLDFTRGIRVGNIEPHERITQILKFLLEQQTGFSFITDRWGRGVYWQWICWLPRANREAKPESGNVNFGCAKFFITIDSERRIFKSGLQIERGLVTCRETPPPDWMLRDDWDWHRLMKQCRKGSALDAELHRLIHREHFVAEIGDWESNAAFRGKAFHHAGQIRQAARKCPQDEWVGFQLYYPMPEQEVGGSTGIELIRAISAVFAEVTPAMNLCMQVALPVTVPPPFAATP